jgi:putative ABC transport system permease protein
MTLHSFILKNALRNKRRALLTVMSVAVSLFLLVTLQVALRELTVPPEDVGAALRVAVRSKVSIANLLPARQRPTIERIPGVESLTPFTFFGGKYGAEESMTFAQFAMDPTKLRSVFGEAKLTPAEYEAFEKEQTACIVGRITAEKYHLKVGDRMPLTSTIFPCSLELKIAGIYSGTIDDRNVFFHHKYFDEASGINGMVGMWWLRVRSVEEMPRVIETINQTFANTSAEVRAETERAFQLGFISMLGNVTMLITSISTVVVFTLVLVSASTMSMAIRERFRELAVLKAIGFRRRELFLFILAESFGLAMLGALIGAGGAWLLYSNVDIATLTSGIFITFEVTPKILGIAFTVAAALGIVSAIAPSIAVARTSVVDGLKTLD